MRAISSSTSSVVAASLGAAASSPSRPPGTSCAGSIREADDVERRDRAADASEERVPGLERRVERARAAGAQRLAEGRVIAGQEPPRERRPLQAPRRLRVARGREVEMRERREDREIVEARKEGRDQARRGVGLRERSRPVALERRVERLADSVPLDGADQALDPEQRQREPGREDRVDERGRRGQERPARPGRARGAERESGPVDERPDRARLRELAAHGGQPLEQAVPRGRALLQPQRAGQRRRGGDAGARDAVVEPQDPDPSPREDVVQRRVVRGIRRALLGGEDAHRVEPPDAGEVRVETLGRRQAREGRLSQPKRPVEAASRPRRVDEEARAPGERRPVRTSAIRERRAAAPERHRLDLGVVDVLRAGLLRAPLQEVVEVRAIPVRVGDLVLGARGDEQLVRAVGGRGERLSEAMAVEGEASLEPAGDPGMPPLPASPRGERARRRRARSGGRGFRGGGWRAGRTTRRSRSAGCDPRSRSRTERPSARSRSAVSEPANPEPRTATSKDPVMRGALGRRQPRPAQIGQATGGVGSWRRFIASSRRSRSE